MKDTIINAIIVFVVFSILASSVFITADILLSIIDVMKP